MEDQEESITRERITFRINTKTAQWMKKTAREEDMNLGEFVRELVKKGIEVRNANPR